jgi:hypothetical protein
VEARADRATVSQVAAGPWDGGDAIVTPIEWLSSKIASHIASHTVSVRCETASSFRALGGADNAGFVSTISDPRTNRFTRTSTIIELAPRVCGALQRFAQAPFKPTRCRDEESNAFVSCFDGAAVARGSVGAALCRGAHCYSIVRYSRDYWMRYSEYSYAISTLAHEAIHTEQAIKGAALPPSELIETQADCYGMQWMPWVAGQLGDAPNDAQSIATYFWFMQYPAKESLRLTKPYWSPDCRPGGRLDIRPPGSTLWP